MKKSTPGFMSWYWLTDASSYVVFHLGVDLGIRQHSTTPLLHDFRGGPDLGKGV